MADISPDEVRSAVETGQVVAGAAGGFLAAIAAAFWKFHRVIRRFEVVESKVESIDSRLSTHSAKIETMEKILPRLMDEDGVIKVFNQQIAVLNEMHTSLRREMDIHNTNLKSEVEYIKAGISELNKNVMELVSRDKRSRPGDK